MGYGVDFNVVRYIEERKAGDTKTRDREGFNKFIQNIDLLDMEFQDGKFTWSSMRENLSLARLDIILISSSWEAKYSLSRVYTYYKITSDHIPLCLMTGEEERKKEGISVRNDVVRIGGIRGGGQTDLEFVGWEFGCCRNHC